MRESQHPFIYEAVSGEGGVTAQRWTQERAESGEGGVTADRRRSQEKVESVHPAVLRDLS